ncbi:unnamed protein product [Cuscuta europaea]|uniref:Retrotransposon Copia-like N-terminal domain-containing protein n=1 Tax=Cuscuta europaea TaxID=41803 RepID=A0A9P0ZDE7_CUSEU|nr:unnamed protein product [Cuscuta europaea]
MTTPTDEVSTTTHTSIMDFRRKINDPSSPYYLHNSDFPGLNICGVALRGESNYREWATAMKNAFRAKRKLGFLDGSISQPTPHAHDLEDWFTVHSMLVGWLMSSIDPPLRSNVAFMDNARDLWDDLKIRFDVADAMRMHELKEAIRTCRQAGQSVTIYFGRLKTLWDDYAAYRILPQCKCGKCSCNLDKEFLESVELEKSHEFLMGLDGEIYGVLRSNILSMTTLPALNKIYQMVVQEERHRNVTRTQDTRMDAVAFAMRPSSSISVIKDGDKEKVFCHFCKKNGHDIKHCFKISGNYPDWWYGNKGGCGRGNTPGQGRGRGGPPSLGVHAVKVEDIPGVSTPNINRASMPMLSDTQWNNFLSMLNDSKRSCKTEKLTGPQFEDADWSG